MNPSSPAYSTLMRAPRPGPSLAVTAWVLRGRFSRL